MKREILLSLGMLLCMDGFAQNIKIEEQRIKEKNDKVFVSFTVVADKIKSNERLTLTPVLYSGNTTKSLQPIIITGRKRALGDKRQLAPGGIRTAKNQHIPYTVTVPYESWMGDVSLRMERKIESCCTEQLLAPQEVVKEKTIRYDVVLPPIENVQAKLSPIEQLDLETPFLAPMKEYTTSKENFDLMRAEGALIVRFRQGRNVIDPTLEDNAQSLEKVSNVLKLIAGDANASVGKIVLAGGSSPEGTKRLNDKLSEERVQTLRTYLNEKANIDFSQIESITIGEDWVELRKMVEQSDMQYKNEVLEIINNVPVMQGREKQLMDLKWGRPYNYMLEHFFPKLRNAGYIRIFYVTTPDMELEKTNQAIGLSNNKEYRDALVRLEGVQQTATTENIRGVCYMMLGEYDKAQVALRKSIEWGNARAAEHLKQLEKLKRVEQ